MGLQLERVHRAERNHCRRRRQGLLQRDVRKGRAPGRERPHGRANVGHLYRAGEGEERALNLSLLTGEERESEHRHAEAQQFALKLAHEGGATLHEHRRASASSRARGRSIAALGTRGASARLHQKLGVDGELAHVVVARRIAWFGPARLERPEAQRPKVEAVRRQGSGHLHGAAQPRNPDVLRG